MPCDTRLKPKQTIQERAEEVRKAVLRLSNALIVGSVKPVIDKKTGAIAFNGFDNENRDGVTDACAYRRIMATGSALAKAKIEQAEKLAGRGVNKAALHAGVHSHDGGESWHHGH